MFLYPSFKISLCFFNKYQTLVSFDDVPICSRVNQNPRRARSCPKKFFRGQKSFPELSTIREKFFFQKSLPELPQVLPRHILPDYSNIVCTVTGEGLSAENARVSNLKIPTPRGRRT